MPTPRPSSDAERPQICQTVRQRRQIGATQRRQYGGTPRSRCHAVRECVQRFNQAVRTRFATGRFAGFTAGLSLVDGLTHRSASAVSIPRTASLITADRVLPARSAAMRSISNSCLENWTVLA